MQIILHIGAHATNEDALLRALLANHDRLHGMGIAVPGPARYRELLRDVIARLEGAEAAEGSGDLILDEIGIAPETRRVILSYPHAMGFIVGAVGREMLYPAATRRIGALLRLFAGHEVTLALGLRNPATWLPELLARQTAKTEAEFLGRVDLHALRWSHLVTRLSDMRPTAGMIVWSDEGAPLGWPAILRALAGVGWEVRLAEADAIARSLLPEAAGRALGLRLAQFDPPDAQSWAALVADHLRDHADPAIAEVEIALSGWTQPLVDDLGARYEADLGRIAVLPALTWLG
ncbi:MAG: hypothetical protein ACO3OO_01110 [Gemmobacter sp.]